MTMNPTRTNPTRESVEPRSGSRESAGPEGNRFVFVNVTRSRTRASVDGEPRNSL